jgi:hypothetical protein
MIKTMFVCVKISLSGIYYAFSLRLRFLHPQRIGNHQASGNISSLIPMIIKNFRPHYRRTAAMKAAENPRFACARAEIAPDAGSATLT